MSVQKRFLKGGENNTKHDWERDFFPTEGEWY